jgi:hypothetical protein
MALSVRDLAVNGRDLIGEVGLAPGPVIGRVLDHLLELVTEDPAQNERGLLLEAARSFVQAAETAVRTGPENQSD